MLVLDDPLSAVDARPRRRSSRRSIAPERVARSILVTNRVAAAARTEQIVVLDEGRVVERGTHDELMNAGGLYARIAERQHLEQELEVL